MAWQVVMEEDGAITLPPDVIAELGWTTETLLSWTNGPDGVSLSPVSPNGDEALP